MALDKRLQVSLTFVSLGLTFLKVLCCGLNRLYESFLDFTGQPVRWTGKICLTNQDFTRPTPFENKQQKRKKYKFLSLNVI